MKKISRWLIDIILIFKRLRQKDCLEFENCLGFRV